MDWSNLLFGVAAIALAGHTSRDRVVQSTVLGRTLVGVLGVAGVVLVIAGFTG